MGVMEVNIEEDEWGKCKYDEDHVGEFDPKLLKEARLEEVNFTQNIGVWETSTWEECMQKTGKAPTRRQGPRRGGADGAGWSRGLQEQERRAELRRIRRHASAGDEEAVV